jgi:hypothetical protein
MLSIFNAALISTGFDEIVSVNDGSSEWRLLSRNFPQIVEAELEDGLYSFTRREAFLQTRSDGGFGFDDAYLVPGNALTIRHLWIDTNGVRTDTDWVQDQSKVHANAPEGVRVEYLVSADPSLWTANFTLGVQKKLEGVLCRFKEEFTDAERMDRDAEMYFDKARKISSRSRSAKPPFKDGPFVRARFSRGRI